MLRPATPLTILLLCAFVCLLLSTISSPIIKVIPLAEHKGVKMGVFGFCKDTQCSRVSVGYDPTTILGGDSFEKDFSIPVATRKSISQVLIIHPIACFFTLVMLILAGVSHLHSPSHSPRYLLGVFILSILTLLLALLSFLIDVLLFVPYMAWGSYVVLAATVLIAAAGMVSCAMRRTLVSRKARKRRIAENAEMNGENYYNRQAGVTPVVAPLSPTLNGGQPGGDKLPAFATFEDSKTNQVPLSEDDKVPLTTRTRSPGDRSPEAGMASLAGQAGPLDRYNQGGSQPGSVVGGPNRQASFDREPRRDQYGNIIPPPQGQGYGAMRGDPRNQYGQGGPQGSGYRGRGGPGGFRGRGGGPGYGRSGYGASGGPGPYAQNQRGMNPMAAGAMGAVGGAMMAGGTGRGGRGPPPGYNNGYGRGGRNDAYGGRAQSPENYGPGSFGQSQSTVQSGPYDGSVARSGSVPPHDNYGGAYGGQQQQRSGSVPPLHHNNDAYGVAYGGSQELARAESPPPMTDIDMHQQVGPVGQAIEMDATTGAPSPRNAQFPTQYGNVRDSDSDVQGMVNMQQQRTGPNGTIISDGSKYSNDVDASIYGAPQNYNRVASPLNPQQGQQPQELGPSPMGSAIGSTMASGGGGVHHRQNSGDNYYEDVDPRFVQPGTEGPVELSSSQPAHTERASVPNALVPGFGRGGGGGGNNTIAEQRRDGQNLKVRERGRAGAGGMGPDGANSYEDLHLNAGSRSPSESERSNFTSVSQRGVNPRWPGNAPQMPPMGGQGALRGGPGGYGGAQRRPQRNEVLLESNPDFQLPGMGPRTRKPVGGQNQGQGRFSPSMGQPQGLTGRSPYDQPGGVL